MQKKHLEPIANSDTVGIDGVISKLREYGATPDMFEYITDTIHALHDRYGPLQLGSGLGLDREATLTNSETKETFVGSLLVFHLDVAREDTPEIFEQNVIIGFMLDESNKISGLVKMS